MSLFLLLFILKSSLCLYLRDPTPPRVIKNQTFRLARINSDSCNQKDYYIYKKLYCNSEGNLTTSKDSTNYNGCLNGPINNIDFIYYSCYLGIREIQIFSIDGFYCSYKNNSLINGENTINMTCYDYYFTLNIPLNISLPPRDEEKDIKTINKKLYCQSNGYLSYEIDLDINTYDGCLPKKINNILLTSFSYEDFIIKYSLFDRQEKIKIYGEKSICKSDYTTFGDSLTNLEFVCFNLPYDLSKSMRRYKYLLIYGEYFPLEILCFDGYYLNNKLQVQTHSNGKLILRKEEETTYTDIPLEPCKLGCEKPDNLSTYGLEFFDGVEDKPAILRCQEGKTNQISGKIICRTINEGVYKWYGNGEIIDSHEQYEKIRCSVPDTVDQNDDLLSNDQTTTTSLSMTLLNMTLLLFLLI